LRRRQGRLVEAADLFERSEPHPFASLGRGELAMDRGDARAACEQAERYLRRVPAQNRIDRAAGLDLLVRGAVGANELDRARTALAELTSIARIVMTTPLRAAASLAAGCVALGSGDPDAARRAIEDAVDGFLQSGASFELARARVELARSLLALGRTDEARQEIQRAIDLFAELKAELEVSRARELLDTAAKADGRLRSSAQAASRDAGLTKREIEVLRLLGAGLSNQAIAEQLFVSEHTIHRHVANIFTKLSVSSRAAAVAQAARRGLL
jgi:LuxR family maltose regulon positive regulatory protein